MSRYSVTLLEEAADDVIVGKRFYEKSEAGLGLYFATSAFADIASLQLHAGVHSIRWGYHRMLLKRFPFAVYYDKDGDDVWVIAVLDMRRDPKSLRAILLERKSQPDSGANSVTLRSTE